MSPIRLLPLLAASATLITLTAPVSARPMAETLALPQGHALILPSLPQDVDRLARRGRGADDAPGHTRRGRGTDDPVGHA